MYSLTSCILLFKFHQETMLCYVENVKYYTYYTLCNKVITEVRLVLCAVIEVHTSTAVVHPVRSG